MPKPSKDTDRMKALLNSVTDEMINGGVAKNLQDDNTVKVERILLDLIRPDPIQPRRVLPDEVHFAFHGERLTPAQALREMVRVAQVAARQRGRPFSHILELLPSPNDDIKDDDHDVKLSPEEAILRELVNLAVTISSDGQVNPITVVDVSQNATIQFRIETGERRYWATWLLRHFLPEYKSDGTVPCIVVPAESSSVFRQARENTARSGLSAIAMARQAALLLLAIHEYELPVTAVNNDFYRQALDLDLRGKREYTEMVLSAMGGIDKSRLYHYKKLLHLSDEAMEVADRHDLDEKKLRFVVSLPSEFHLEIVRQIIDFNLTSKQVKALCAGENEHPEAQADALANLAPSALRFAKVAKTTSTTPARDLAQAMLHQEGDVQLARARLNAMKKLIDEAEKYLKD